MIIQALILHYPDPNKRNIVYTDASDDACGTQLLQEHDGTEFPIAFLSHTFTETKGSGVQPKRRHMEFIMPVTKWKYYLQDADIMVQNDHKPLAKFLNGKKCQQ